MNPEMNAVILTLDLQTDEYEGGFGAVNQIFYEAFGFEVGRNRNEKGVERVQR